MTTSKAVILSLVALGGCAEAGDPFRHGDDDPGTDARVIMVEPAVASVDVVDGQEVTQDYRAYLVDTNGERTDITDRATFELADPRFGSWLGETAWIDGSAAGVTHVVAMADGVRGEAQLAVHVNDTQYDDVDPEIAAQFADATPMANCATRMVYPAHGTVLPANLGALDVRWNDVSSNDLYQVRIANAYVDRTIYTRNAAGFAIDAAAWQLFATSRDHVEISIAGLTSSDPSAKCVAPPRTVDITDADAPGAVYYSATQAGDPSTGMLVRHSMSDGGEAQPVVAPKLTALARDGSKMAVTLDGHGAVYDLASNRMEMMGNEEPWSAATFTPDGRKLLAVTDGQMKLFDVSSGRQLAAYPDAIVIGRPEMSPDGTQVVSAETSAGLSSGSATASSGASVVVRAFNPSTNALGQARTLVAFDAAIGLQSRNPSWSPDGKWIAITRSSPVAAPTVWVVPVLGGAHPLPLTTHADQSAWARWMPYESSVRGEKVFFLSFSSTRAYGNELAEGRQQLWMQPFFPGRAYEAGEITAPAYHAPFQNLATANHDAHWATGFVIP